MSLLFDDVEFGAASPPSSVAGGEERAAWERGSVFLDQFLQWCAGVVVENVPVDVAVAMISKLAQMTNSLEGLRLGLAAHVDQVCNPQLPDGRARPLPGDQPDLTGLMQASGGQSRDKAREEVRRAQTIRDTYPLFGARIRSGVLSPAYVDVLRTRIPAELCSRAQADEEYFLGRAMQETVDQFAKTVRAWVVRHAPERAEKKAAEAARAERFSIFPAEGGYRLAGWLDPINGLQLDKTMRSLVGVPAESDKRSHAQRYADVLTDLVAQHNGQALAGSQAQPGPQALAEAPAPYDQPAPAPTLRHNPRTQIMVHVPLATLVQTDKAIETGCRHLSSQITDTAPGNLPPPAPPPPAPPPPAPAPPPLARESSRTAPFNGCELTGQGLGRHGECLNDRTEVTESLGAVLGRIRAGIAQGMLAGFQPALLEDGTALAPSQLASMLCDSSLTRIVLTAHGEPLDASRAQRTFSATQAKAVLVRDRTCRYPGCDRGIEVGQIHHAQQWEKGGATIIDNAVLLCYRHHNTVHANEITITHHVGGFVFSRPDGTILATRLHETNTGESAP